MSTDLKFSKLLNKWYSHNARSLPWRETKDPYKIWISEIMLQQTTVNAVIPYYKKWIKEFPSVNHVACAPLEKILKSWQGLGYYTRARNIHAASKIIVHDFDCKIPKDPQKLKKLPGFGPYTVGAVLSIAYNLQFTIIDANVRRVFMRILAIEGQATTTHDPVIRIHLEKILPKRNTGNFNQALMELGALLCRSQNPLCLQCPVNGLCKAYKKGIQEITPASKKMEYKDLDVAIGILKKGSKFFIQQRPAKGLLADLWEFPGGKLEPHENKQKALARELKEECDVTIEESQHFMDTIHFYTNHRVKLHVYFCKSKKYPTQGDRKKWVSLKEMLHYPMPSGSAKIVNKLKNLS